ncbi:hemagglutinin/amebocyte aggregation factor-like [Nematostella vectensis]|nr:hemagglutinin/amebocyte aggregation factor isoform X2 [Nematostella vectensis]XP_032233067.1 hemagglutinin/amebocyte aggregation factor isoform X2 [Nematostella vectensis]XP_048586829.1 hemagglutinin/amebocyte aggregation factor-like [Nematostella vectensis]
MRSKCLVTLLLVALIVMDHVTDSMAWRRRRRRRCSTPSTSGGNWVNYYDNRATFSCPSGQSVYKIQSQYSTCHNDRVWKYKCRSNPALQRDSYCSWSDWVNDYDNQMVIFHCPLSGFITGFDSYHSNSYHDRKFRFRCCNDFHYFKRYQCTITSYQSSWRSKFSFSVPSGYYLSGLTSVNNNYYEDRRWKYEYCKTTAKQHG